jgi:hypothetical protein
MRKSKCQRCDKLRDAKCPALDSMLTATSDPDCHPAGLGRRSATIAGIPGKVVWIVGIGTLPYFAGTVL